MKHSSPSWLNKVTRLLVIALATSIGLSLLLGIIWFIIFDDSEALGRLLSAIVVLAACFGALLAATVPVRRGRLVILMGVSMLMTIVGSGLLVLMIAGASRRLNDSQEHAIKFAATLLIVGVALAHNGALWMIVMPSRVLAAVRIAVMGCAWSAGGLAFLIMWAPDAIDNSLGDFFFILGLMFFLILAVVAGTIAVPLAAISRANKEVMPVESLSSRVSLRLECPKCREQQELRAGNVRCRKCGAGLLIEIEEPRCECGYLLYQLHGDTCPECGRAIPETQRWRDGRLVT